jgi:peptidoglycan/LPS O-acetylase OafA/YrhL
MEKLKFINGLRGLAAVLVVVHHYSTAFFPAIYLGKPELANNPIELLFYYTPLSIFFNGSFAVCLFFILSGFVLSYKYFNLNAKQYIIADSIKRYIRLGIPVFATILFAYILMINNLLFHYEIVEFTHSAWLGRLWNFSPDISSMLNSGLYGALLFGDSSYYTNLWTIQIEFLGSLLVFVVLLLKKFRFRYLVYCLVIFYFKNTYYLSMILGMVLCDVASTHVNIIPALVKYRVLFFLLLCIGLFLGSYPLPAHETGLHPYIRLPGTDTRMGIIFLQTIGALCIVVAIMNIEKLKKILTNKVLLFLGEISYALYLTHLFVIGTVSSLLFNQFYKSNSYYASFLMMFIISIPILLALAWTFTKLVDNQATNVAVFIYSKIHSNKNKIVK